MTIAARSGLYLVLLLTFAGRVAAQTFTDSTFNNASWSSILLPSSASGAKCGPGQDMANGNPAPSRRTQHIYPQGWINCAHLWLGATYDPSAQGAIVNMSYSYDLIHYTADLGGVRYSPLIFQNNTYYWIPLGDDIRSASWSPFSRTNLTEASFTKFEGPSDRTTPDFSCHGPKMQFGYLTRNHLPGDTTITTESGIDNWTIKIDGVERCDVQMSCPSPWVPTPVNGVRYCCPEGINAETPDFCCFRACPPGSVQTTVNGVRFCCERDSEGGVCCRQNGLPAR